MITFSEEAFTKIKLILENNSLKYPRITLKKIGCAGNTLILTLEEKDTADSVVEVNGIKFAISKDALP
ncbi:MAG: hypothetical protein LBF70_01805, partial [Holosporales bacterium]|nr:hypothetical protein [Holosporales bacterium]